jgi:hypothetical protein
VSGSLDDSSERAENSPIYLFNLLVTWLASHAHGTDMSDHITSFDPARGIQTTEVDVVNSTVIA